MTDPVFESRHPVVVDESCGVGSPASLKQATALKEMRHDERVSLFGQRERVDSPPCPFLSRSLARSRSSWHPSPLHRNRPSLRCPAPTAPSPSIRVLHVTNRGTPQVGVMPRTPQVPRVHGARAVRGAQGVREDLYLLRVHRVLRVRQVRRPRADMG